MGLCGTQASSVARVSKSRRAVPIKIATKRDVSKLRNVIGTSWHSDCSAKKYWEVFL